VEPIGDGRWRVIYVRQDETSRTVPVRMVTARFVVLAAGTLGSTEILMRSRERGLSVSDRLGKGFSTNADAIAFGYNNTVPVNAIGIGAGPPPRKDMPRPGPAVTGLIDFRRRQDPADRLAIVEASVQSAMAALLPFVLPAGAMTGTSTQTGLSNAIAELQRTLQSVLQGAYTGAVHNTQVFLAVGHDGARGELALKNDQTAITWPEALKNPVYERINATLEKAVAATGGTYVPNPVSNKLLGGNLMTVLPLGGCGMGEDRTRGVVDHKGRVFDADPGRAADAVHEGLYVMDGSIVPRSLGVHPLLTITALAERSMLLLARDLKRELPLDPPANAPQRDFTSGVRVLEKRPGFMSRMFGRGTG
jgi:cholesterol oxidase